MIAAFPAVRRPASGSTRLGDAVSGLAVGAPADVVVVPAETVTAAVMDRRPRTLVVHRGHVVARDGRLV